MPGADAHCRISVACCKPCANPHDSDNILNYLPVGLTQYILNNFTKKLSPYHVSQDDVSAPLQRLEVDKSTGHQSVRGGGGLVAVMHETHWTV